MLVRLNQSMLDTLIKVSRALVIQAEKGLESMVRKDYVKKVFLDSIYRPQPGVIPFMDDGLTDEEIKYLEEIAEKYDYTQVDDKYIYEH